MQKLFEFRTLILNSNLKVKKLKLEKDKKKKKDYQMLKNHRMEVARQKLSSSLSFCKLTNGIQELISKNESLK
jgi:ABC-type nitrate/sulfonate/bicarbonate transport system ATPase subunit